MRSRAAFLLMPLLLLGSIPVRAQILGQIPIISETLMGTYQTIAECAHAKIDRLGETGVRKTDLPGSKQIKLTLESGGVRYWEITFSDARNRSTLIEMTVVRTMWGPSTTYANKIMPEVRACDKQ